LRAPMVPTNPACPRGAINERVDAIRIGSTGDLLGEYHYFRFD
jgi:hypothetical protein